MTLFGLLIAVLVVCAVVWIAMRLTKAFSVPEPLATVILVVVVVAALLWLLSAANVPMPRVN